MKGGILATSALFAVLLTGRPSRAQVDSLADLTQLVVQSAELESPTTINVGADGKLYVTQQDGLVVVLTVERSFTEFGGELAESWSVTERQDVTLIQAMPNHDDQGRFQPTVTGRLITGALADVDTNGHVTLYIASSDPRISIETDSNLDTNSGVISQLTQRADSLGDLILVDGQPVWDKIDLVRGFPRSEENHAVNGIVRTTTRAGRSVLLLPVGGHTNAGAQSNNFAYTPEYFYAGAIVALDLDALNALPPRSYAPRGIDHPYLFDLPTLDDPTRPNDGNGDLDGEGQPSADVFGGNDGLNQAVFDPSGTVSLYATGFRNAYDLVVTEGRSVCTVDNGANAGWGNAPVNAAGDVVADSTGDGLADNGPALNLPNDSGELEQGDQLHCFTNDVALEDYASVPYAGHPNLFRAHGAAAGFFMFAAAGNPWNVPAGQPLTLVNGALAPGSAPEDLAPWIPDAAALTGTASDGQPQTDPRQEVVLAPPREGGLFSSPDGALYTFQSSTNGITEYTAGGGLAGALLTVSFSGAITAVYRDGLGAVSDLETRQLTSQPLDVVAQGAEAPYPGVIFVAAYGADQIVVLSPNAGIGVEPDPNDRDRDGLDDSYDPFSVDPSNGRSAVLGPGDDLFWSFTNGEAPPNEDPDWYDGAGGFYAGGALGFTGIMTNRAGLPETLYDPENIIFGGAPGIVQLKAAEAGSPDDDTQRNGFQLGLTPGEGLESFLIQTETDAFFDQTGSLPGGARVSQGLFVGSGDQNNFVAVSVVKTADGRTGFEVSWQFAFDFVGEVPLQSVFYDVPELEMMGDLDTVTLGLDVELGTGDVTPVWDYTLLGIPHQGRGLPVLVDGDVRKALEGTLRLPNDLGGTSPVGFAVGILSTLDGAPDAVFALDWKDLSVRGRGPRATTYSKGEFVYALNAGGGFFRDGNRIEYEADPVTDFTFGQSVAIGGTPSPFLYQSERYAPDVLRFQVPVPPGTYLVELNFAEIFGPNRRPGARVFDVALEGNIVVPALDIFSEVGADHALILAAAAPVVDGVLDLELTGIRGDPKISAFSVWEGRLVTDEVKPTVDIHFGPPPENKNDWVEVFVVLKDDVAFDPVSFSPDDVQVTGSGGPLEVEVGSTATDATGATLVLLVRPVAGWAGDEIRVSLPGGRVGDTSGNGNTTQGATFQHVPRPPGAVVFALNAGGEAFIASDGVPFAASPRPSARRSMAVIQDTEDEVLYQTVGDLSPGYSIPLSDGWYRVEMHFAAVFDEYRAPFDVTLQGETVFEKLSVSDAAGGPNTALILDATVQVIDGALSLGTNDDGFISAFSVWESTPPPPTPDTAPPEVALRTLLPVNIDDPLRLEIQVTDNEGVDLTTLTPNDVVFAGHPAAVLLSERDGSALIYLLELAMPWAGQIIEAVIDENVFADTSGNGVRSTRLSIPLPTRPRAYLVRAVNSGGDDYRDQTGIPYSAGALGPRYTVSDPIAGTDDDTLYQSERYHPGGFTYEVPVVDGEYTIQLHFAEIFRRARVPGVRTFNVRLEGQDLRTPLDIVGETGAPFSALTIEGTAIVTDGALTFSFDPLRENPKLSAYSVWGDVSPVPPPPPTGRASELFSSEPIAPLTDLTDPYAGRGRARLSVTPGTNVQTSNFQPGSFVLENTGTRRIVAVFVDTSTALFPDSVFDANGTGGDDAAKPLAVDGDGGTAPVRTDRYPTLHLPVRGPSFDPNATFDPGSVPGLFVDSVSDNGLASPSAGGGFRAALLLFDDFLPGRTATFSGDMDPNSIAGLTVRSATRDSNSAGVLRPFDVGGISGAEIAGSTVTVQFGDGTQATGTLAPDGSQSGALAVVDTGRTDRVVDLSVDGRVAGETGTYGQSRPSVEIAADPGTRVRVTLVKGFNPVQNLETVGTANATVRDLVAARLGLQYPFFPVNNAVQWQHVERVVSAEGRVDVSGAFDYAAIDGIDGADDFDGDDTLPIAFVAVAIDDDGEPVGPVTAPIYLLNDRGPVVD